MPDSRLTTAMKGLDPASRALLDLSLRRRIPDDEIAHLLRTTPREIALRRATAIRRLGADLEIERPEQLTAMLAAFAELPPEAWGVPSAGAVAPDSPPPRAVPVGPRSRGRGLRRVALAGVPLSVLSATVAMALIAGGDETAIERGHLAPGSGQGLNPPAPAQQSGALAARDRARDDEAGTGGDALELVAELAVAELGVDAAPPPRHEKRKQRKPRRERTRRRKEKSSAPTPAISVQQPVATISGVSSFTDLDQRRDRRRGPARTEGGPNGGGPAADGPQSGSGGGGSPRGPKLFGDDKPGRGPIPQLPDGGVPGNDPQGQGPQPPDGPPRAPAILPQGLEGKRRRRRG